MNSPRPKLRRDTRVFISAVTRELGSVREIVKTALLDIDIRPVVQTHFPPDYRELVEFHRQEIAKCDAVIHIVGHCYGEEPQPLPDGVAIRRSYTQLEYDLAVELGKPVYVFLTGDGFPADPHAPEDAERTELQVKYRQRLIEDGNAPNGKLFTVVASSAELDQKVRVLPLRVEGLHEELVTVDREVMTTRHRMLTGLALSMVLVITIGWGVSQLRHDMPKLVEHAKDATVQALTDPAALAETIRKQIHATVETKIKALPDELGRWRLIAEIEKERDAALGRVDDLIKLIQEGLKEGASPVFQRAAEILQKEGTDAALAYLESSRPSTLETARRHAARTDAEKEQRNKTLQALVLEAKLLETKLQWQPALQLREQVAELAPDWFAARNHLGKLLQQLALYREAEPHQRAAVALATNLTDEAIALNNLATLVQDTNRLAEAEPLMRRALQIDEQCYGAEHPSVATDLNNLATLLIDTNRLAEAEPLLARVVTILENPGGKPYLNYTGALNNLAQLLQDTNRLAEAEPLMRRALAIDEQSYGAEHPNVAIRLNNLAQLLKETNRPTEAEPHYRRTLAIFEKSYGPEHPNVAVVCNNLGQLFQATNNLDEAETHYRRALAIDEQSYGAVHPNVAISLNNLGQLLQTTDRLDEAEPLMRRCRTILRDFRVKNGHEHPRWKTYSENYRQLLEAMKFSPDEIEAKLLEMSAE